MEVDTPKILKAVENVLGFLDQAGGSLSPTERMAVLNIACKVIDETTSAQMRAEVVGNIIRKTK